MTTKEIDNQIAMFLGVYPNDKGYYQGMDLKSVGLPFSPGWMGTGTNDLKFSTSWDWLMVACKRFDDLWRYRRNDWGDENALMYEQLCDSLDNTVSTYNITSAYQQLAKNVEWYFKTI